MFTEKKIQKRFLTMHSWYQRVYAIREIQSFMTKSRTC